MKKHRLTGASLVTALLSASFSARAAAWVAQSSSADAPRLLSRHLHTMMVADGRRQPTLIAPPRQTTRRQKQQLFSLFQSSASSSEKETIASGTDSRGETKEARTSVGKESGDASTKLDEKQHDFIVGYMNKHHTSLLKKFATIFSPIGREMAQANVFSGGSYSIEDAKLVNISTDQVSMQVVVQRRGKPTEQRSVSFPLATAVPVVPKRDAVLPPAVPEPVLQPRRPIDDVVRKLMRLCWMVDEDEAAVTGKLIQLAIQLGGAGVGELPENM